MEGGSTEIGRQRSEKRRIEQARLCSRSTARSTGGGGRSTARSTGVHKRAQEGAVDRPGRPTDKGSLSVGHGRPGRSTMAWVGRPAGRPTGAFDFPFRIRIPFLDGIESNLGFHKSRDSVAINRGKSPHVLYPKKYLQEFFKFPSCISCIDC